jgi:hypothetical protein
MPSKIEISYPIISYTNEDKDEGHVHTQFRPVCWRPVCWLVGVLPTIRVEDRDGDQRSREGAVYLI